ncbi:DUF2130 domain-containing protein [bacterium]|nr:DUF2130 domain-containing protein [bacterium]
MNIVCPHCKQVFDLNEDAASHIREQIRTEAFEKELNDKVELVKKTAEIDTKSRVTEAVMKERDKYETCLADFNRNISDLNTQLAKAEAELKTIRAENELALKQSEMTVKELYLEKVSDLEAQLKAKDCELGYYKDLKTKMSTKMIGETLEQHCETEFNKIRMAAFPRAEFGKDNTVSRDSGSKGDYIFREYDENGVEIISIMFEMKNEADTTATKKKNEHFFKELNKDRNEKKCEYAILVSLLEADNDLYNQGIVDVSYLYDKMYVIRPQFFIPLISLLRNAALSSLETKRELVKIQNQNLDIANFRTNFDTFKNAFGYNYEQAGKRLNEAVSEIDKAIQRLEAVKASLLASDKQLSLANKKVDDMTIEKLCKGSPLLIEMINNGEQC